jgi:hypothetical protein
LWSASTSLRIRAGVFMRNRRLKKELVLQNVQSYGHPLPTSTMHACICRNPAKAPNIGTGN